MLAAKQFPGCSVQQGINVTYDKQIDKETWNIGNLAITLPVLEQMNLRNIVNQHLPTSSGREPGIDHGTIVELMTAARLSGRHEYSEFSLFAAHRRIAIAQPDCEFWL